MRKNVRVATAVLTAVVGFTALSGCAEGIRAGVSFGEGFSEEFEQGFDEASGVTPEDPNLPNPDLEPLDSEFVGTVWSGTDSAGDDTTFELEEDGTVKLTFNGVETDYANDIWVDEGGWLSINVYLDEYETSAGYYGGLTEPGVMEFDALTFQTGRSFTLTATLESD
jgi:hypothetical protein